MADWRFVVLATLIASTSLSIYYDRVTLPSCEIVVPPSANSNETVSQTQVQDDDPHDLKAIIVSNLLLLSSDSSFFHTFFRDFFLSKFLSKSFETLKPDMLLVLGDITAKGYQLKRNEWSSVLKNFQTILGPYLHLPLHVTLGDRDIGDCDNLNPGFVQQISSSFPGLDSAGCGSFEINNVSFVSLNTVALLCGNNELLSDVETVIERESAYLQRKTEEGKEQIDKSSGTSKASYEFRWRENRASSRSGPVLLVHFPLHRISKSYCKQGSSSFSAVFKSLPTSLKLLWSRTHADSGPYDLLQNVPPNATEYIFQSLKPRMIFSAHGLEFCDIKHPDGTREVTVPALSWTAKNDPGFVAATFRRNEAITVRHCTLPSESLVLLASAIICASSILIAVLTSSLHKRNLIGDSLYTFLFYFL